MMSAPAAWALFSTSALLSLGASAVLVTRLERFAARLGLREAALGLVAALAADGPEITAAVTGLLRGQRTIGVGVVLGSNAFNLAALLGAGALSAGRIRLHRDVVVFAGSIGVLIAALSVGAVSGALHPGLALGLSALVFVPYVIASSVCPTDLRTWPLPNRFRDRLAQAVADEEAELAPIHPPRGTPRDAGLAVLALGAVVGSSVFMEHAASTLGDRYRISDIVTGGVILAAVTSLPNAVAAIYLAHRNRGTAVLSTALNSNSFNVLFGLLVPAVFVGIADRGGSGVVAAGWYAGITVGSLVLAYRGRGLGRVTGALVVCAYLGFVVTLVARS